MNKYLEIKDENGKVRARIEMTEQMKKDLHDLKQYFLSQVIRSRRIDFPNGFVGVGILKKPEKHVFEGANNVKILLTGFNSNATRIAPTSEINMTVSELKYLAECINDFLKIINK